MKERKPDEHFGHKFRMISNAIDKHMSRKNTPYEVVLTRAQCGIIHYILEHPDEMVCQKDLEEAFHISGATATNLLNGMERHDMIERVPYAGDARRKQLCLTQKAVDLDSQVHEKIISVENRIVDGFTEEEICRFRSMLDRVIKNLSQMDNN